MKNQIIGKFGRKIGVIGMISVLSGSLFAQNSLPESCQIRRNPAEQIHQLAVINPKENPFLQINAAKARNGQFITAQNRLGFNVATQFTMAKFDASLFGNNREVKNMLVVALVYLINDLEGEPEAAQLQKTLKLLLDGKTDAAQLLAQIENASESFSNRLSKEQKWYFASGAAVTNLLIGTYMSDNTTIRKNLSEIKTLTKIAPEGTSDALIVKMDNLTKYAFNANFTDADYNILIDAANQIGESVNA